MRNQFSITILVLCIVMAGSAGGQEFRITSLSASGILSWTNVYARGICTVESSASPHGPWLPERNFYTTTRTIQVPVTISDERRFFRLLTSDISSGTPGFNNLIASYGILSTVAGRGRFDDDLVNYWQPEFEGGPADSANLSRPHFAMADMVGNIFIADKNSHAILKVTPEGTIHTVAGTHEAGDDGNQPRIGTNARLNAPNGLWVGADGTVFILDTDNSKVRRLDTNGILTTLFTVDKGIKGGRGLWVRDDETLAYFASETEIRRWTASNGIKTFRDNFIDLGNLVVDEAGNVIATDRGANAVYRVTSSNRTRIAGNGTTSGGGDGFAASDTGLAGVRGIWLMPHGGYLLATHEGSQVWYVDPDGIIHLFLDGAGGRTHGGDGDWFFSPGIKISEPRSVTMDHQGNILITESDYGFVRKIAFQRLWP